MTDDDLDRILSHDGGIVPSSGFVSSVMDAVKREAATPPAIPFPWKRALPGLAAWVIALVALAIGPPTTDTLDRLLKPAASIGAGWIALALLLSFLLVKLSLRLAGARR